MKPILPAITLLLATFFLVSCQQASKEQICFTDHVDPHIGSDYHGHVFVGASVPFGAIQLGPNNAREAWDWCSGYHYSDSVLVGFAHTHLSGTGIGDLGDILFMPVIETPTVPDTISQYPWQAHYTHNDEKVSLGYYSIYIPKTKIKAELTCTQRVGFHKYTYPNNNTPQLIIDLNYGTGWDVRTKSFLKQSSPNTIDGYRFSKGWAKDQRIFFHTEFSKKIKNIKILTGSPEEPVTVALEFEGQGELLAKTAISPVSITGARQNLKTELLGWDFENCRQQASQAWNKELSKIEIKTNNPTLKRTFYTAFYHTMIAPALFDDAEGTYRGADGLIHSNPKSHSYTVFSLWDTYRAAHPLFTLTQTERVSAMINTMLNIFDEQGKLPVWHLHGNETNTMVGNHAIPVIVDAYLKGITGFDPERAFRAIKQSMLLDERGLKFIKNNEYIPADSTFESVAMGLEYAIDDWCVAAMAQRMGKTEDFEYFSKRAQYYQHYFDRQSLFMRGKLTDGSWRSPFDPAYSNHRNDDYCEGNAWQYTWLVPHDVKGLIQLFPDEKTFINRLDSLFLIKADLGKGASVDISGLIGIYAHGNEPGHHIPYLYAYAGQQWKTAEKVIAILTQMYSDKPDGLCGNEDCGQMSAWYIFSSLGFYPVNPAGGVYVFGSPLFKEAKIHLASGKTFKIKTNNYGKNNIYIQAVTLNGKPYHKSYITHAEIMNGGTLEFTMDATPNKNFGATPEARPQ